MRAVNTDLPDRSVAARRTIAGGLFQNELLLAGAMHWLARWAAPISQLPVAVCRAPHGGGSDQ